MKSGRLFLLFGNIRNEEKYLRSFNVLDMIISYLLIHNILSDNVSFLDKLLIILFSINIILAFFSLFLSFIKDSIEDLEESIIFAMYIYYKLFFIAFRTLILIIGCIQIFFWKEKDIWISISIFILIVYLILLDVYFINRLK